MAELKQNTLPDVDVYCDVLCTFSSYRVTIRLSQTKSLADFLKSTVYKKETKHEFVIFLLSFW